VLGELLGVTPASALGPDRTPGRIVVDVTGAAPGGGTTAATTDALAVLQNLLRDPRTAATELIWATRGAIGAGAGDPVDALGTSPLWGLVRSARNEYPERGLRLLDLGPDLPGRDLLTGVLAVSGEPEIVLRGEHALVPRLVRVTGKDTLVAPAGPAGWRLDVTEKGRLDAFALVGVETGPLRPGEARIRVRASGLNFRDVLNTLGMVDAPKLGLECAGVVLEVAPDVTHLKAGDRVMGLAAGTFGTEVRGDARLLTPIPAGLSFAEAATVPLAFLTAHHALTDLADLRPGQRILIHAAAGGVGMAAVQLARHRGAEVFGTASPAKWPALHALGLDDDHLASSRDTTFAGTMPARTGGQGFDLVLNSLSGEFVDASLRMLPRGGDFLEMGKTDIRDAATVAAAHPGVRYQAFDLMDAGPDRILQLLTELSELLDRGAVTPLPLVAHDVRQAPAVFRHMAQGRHVGKLVLTSPRELDPAGTALITGGTGQLGSLLAHHLVAEHGVRHLVLTSRRGSNAPGAADLVTALRAAGADTVQVHACDVADRDDVARVLAGTDPRHPLTAVFHLAATIDDGMLANQDAARLSAVLAPKVRGAWHLHELTGHLDLAAFVLFSSVAGAFGAPGQSTYAAANTFLDALAAYRRTRGLTAVSLAWGLWEQDGNGMTGGLGAAEIDRMRRQGTLPLSARDGLRLLDAGLSRPETHLVPFRFDAGAARREDAAEVPALLRVLVRPLVRQAADQGAGSGTLRTRLAGLAPADRTTAAVRFVQQEVSSMLGLSSTGVGADKPIRDFGCDSLMAVELRNRIAKAAQLPLPSTLVFDYPTSQAIASFVLGRMELGADLPTGPPNDPAAAARWALDRVSPAKLQQSGLLAQLLELAQPMPADGAPESLQDTAAAMRIAEELTDLQMDDELDAILGSVP
jgi:polyketide synthase 12